MRLIVLVSLTIALAVLTAGSILPAANLSGHSTAIKKAMISVTNNSGNLVVEAIGQESFDAVLSFAHREGLAVKSSYEPGWLLALEIRQSAAYIASKIADIPGVKSVSTESKAHIDFTPDDPGITYQWGLDTINAYEAWDISRGTHDVVVAVLDTGIDWNHPDLSSNMWNDTTGLYHGYNFVADNWVPMDDNVNGYDSTGKWVPNQYTYHGTHVAGVIGAVTNNAVGMAGLAQVRLMAVKVMNDSGEGTDYDVARGLRWAVDHGANVVCMSLGVESQSFTLESAVDYASSNGVVMVAAAGNSGSSVISYPALYGQVISVGATDTLNRRASFSNFGIGLDIMAPGVDIYSTQGGGSYHTLSGTSTAAPHVAGVAALMLSINPALTAVEIGLSINITATDISRTGYDTSTGWGIVDAFTATESVASPTVTITHYPQYVTPNTTYSITWLVSGGSPGNIQVTYLRWGDSSTSLTQTTPSYSGQTWQEFTVNDLQSPPVNGTIFMKAYAEVDGVMYESAILSIPVHEGAATNPLLKFIRSVGDFIMNDLGLTNFLIILAFFIAIPLIVFAARPRRKKAVIYAARPAPAMPMRHYQPVKAVQYVPPPPPPPPRYEAYVDLVGREIVPQVVKVIEGTKVVWINRSWSPPPGIAIRSGTLDSTGEHSDGLFQSGLLIAPGDYWSCTFHRAGEYNYYITGIWKPAKIVVEAYKPKTAVAS
jgi:subtilisin family serine protease